MNKWVSECVKEDRMNDEWMNKLMKEEIIYLMNEWMNESINQWMSKWVSERINEWV